jgi:hypothetical protein
MDDWWRLWCPSSQLGGHWIVEGKLLIDCTPLSKAEEYGYFKIYSDEHLCVWERFQQSGIAPPDMEYEEAPRGRVSYNMKTRRFVFLADRCVLRKKNVVKTIMADLNLPSGHTDEGTDTHYRCFACLRGISDRSRALRLSCPSQWAVM